MEVQVTAERGPRSCPYCKDALEADEELHRCAACDAVMHLDCAEELGRCAACGAESPTSPGREVVQVEVPVRPEGPAATPPWTGQLPDPPGTRIALERTLQEVRVRWGNEGVLSLVATLASLLVCPIAAPYLLALTLLRARGEARFGRDELEVMVEGPFGIPRRRAFPRAIVQGARLELEYPATFLGRPSPIELTTTGGSHRLVTGVLFPALDPWELEWLTQSIQRWSLAGRPAIPSGTSSARERRRRRKRRGRKRR